MTTNEKLEIIIRETRNAEGCVLRIEKENGSDLDLVIEWQSSSIWTRLMIGYYRFIDKEIQFKTMFTFNFDNPPTVDLSLDYGAISDTVMPDNEQVTDFIDNVFHNHFAHRLNVEQFKRYMTNK